MSNVAVLKEQSPVAAAVGKALSIAELEAQYDAQAARVADVEKRITEAVARVKRRAVELLGTNGGIEQVNALQEAEVEPLQLELKRAQFALDAALEALEAARKQARAAGEAAARAWLSAEFDAALEIAKEAQAHADKMIDAVIAYHERITSAATQARSKMSAVGGVGLRLSGASMTNFMPWQLQKSLEIHLHHRTKGFFRSQVYPLVRGGLFFADLQARAHAELLATVEARYASTESAGDADAGDSAAGPANAEG